MERSICSALILAGLLCALTAGVQPVGAGTGVPWSAAGAERPPGDLVERAVTNQSAGDDGPRIVGLYPDPVTRRDRGEFVTVAFPPGTNLTEYELADNQGSVTLSPDGAGGANTTDTTLTSNTVPDGRVTFSTDPGLTEWLTDGTVAVLHDGVQLANGGETIRLLHRGEVVDSVQYASASEGDVLRPKTGAWTPLGATDRPTVTAEDGTVEAFVLPDEPDRSVAFLDSATERILLAGYTVTSRRVVESLRAAIERGVAVQVLAEGSPVGGMTAGMATALSELDRSGATVRVLAGDRARYRYHHAKYAVVDDRALVTTENWKPAGTGGMSSRGWGAITDQQRIVGGLVETYRADVNWVDTIPWSEHNPSLVEESRSTGDYPSAFESRELPVDRTHLLVTPDNADRTIRETIAAAEESIAVKQVSVGDRSFPFLQAVLDAATRGVEVRILLSSAWYIEEENRQLAAWLRDQATAADLPLSVRLVEPRGAFEKLHAKGMIVDGTQVLLGSLNWNRNSLQNNREVALLLEGEATGDYFRAVFEADWQGAGGGQAWNLPLGLWLAVLAGGVLAVLGLKRIRFD